MTTPRRFLLAFCLLLVSIAAAAQQTAGRPDLIVVISIDQFAYFYIPRFQPYFSPDGFNRFLKNGANFTEARYTYGTTVTGPGHAAIGTGYTPSRSGIVMNNWLDRTSGDVVYCAADPRAEGGYSPVNLQSDSLGDRVQEKYPGAKVFGVAIKDRAAILMAGRKATAAYWYDWKGPRFVTSSYYTAADQALLNAYNKTIPDYIASHPAWEQSGYIPAADLARITHDPENLRKYKTDRSGMGVSFPHPIRGADALTYSPFGNNLLIYFAEQLINTEKIGTPDGTPDLLFISLSSTDYLGHNYGPDSLEAADNVVRTDRDLAAFFKFLDQHFGNRVTVALTADHGVQSIPEVARDMGRDAGRINFRNPSKDMKTMADLAKIAPDRVALEKQMARQLGVRLTDSSDVSKGLIAFFEEPYIYINWARAKELKLEPARAKQLIRDTAKKIRGVSGAFTNTELMLTTPPASELEALVRRGFRADRCGDVAITLKDGWIWDWSGTGASHGQPVEADRHVPVMLWGSGVKNGSYAGSAAPTDLARSLGALLGVDAGGADTQILPCIQASGNVKTPTIVTDPLSMWNDDRRVLSEVIRAALAQADPQNKAKIAVSADLNEAARLALAGVRNISALPANGQYTLPPDFLRFDEVTVNGNEATVRVWHGPIEKPKPGVVSMNCGTGFTYRLAKDAEGNWAIVNVGVAMC